MIKRNLRLPEFTTKNIKNLIINQFTGQLIKQVKILNPQKSCLLSVDEVRQTTLNVKFHLMNLTCINLTLILIKQEKITLLNCKFTENILLITKTSEQLGVLVRISEQEQKMVFSNIHSENNIQHSYIQDISFISSSTILLITPYSTVEMITNGENSNLILIIKSVSIIDSQILVFFSQHLNWGFSYDDQVQLEDFYESYSNIFQRRSGIYKKFKDLFGQFICKQHLSTIRKRFLSDKSFGSLELMNSKFVNCKTFTKNSENQIYKQITLRQKIPLAEMKEDALILSLPEQKYLEVIFVDDTFLKIPVSLTSSSLLLFIQFANVQITYSYSGYLEEIVDLKRIEVSNLKKKNYLIQIDQKNVIMQNYIYRNIFNYGFFQIVSVVNQQYLQIGHQKFCYVVRSNFQYNTEKKIFRVKLHQKKYLQKMQQNHDFVEILKDKLEVLLNSVYKCSQNLEIPEKKKQSHSIIFKDNQWKIIVDYNFQQRSSVYFTLFIFQTFKMEKIIVQVAKVASFKLQILTKADSMNLIYIGNSTFKNNTYGQFGFVVMLSLDQKSNQIQNKNRILQSVQIIDNINTEVIILNNVFIENKATYGGALFQNEYINQQFLERPASLSIMIVQKLQLYNSLITHNCPNVGGGLYLEKYQLKDLKILKNYLRNNKAQKFGDTLAENFSQLTINEEHQLLWTKRITTNNESVLDQIIFNNYTIGSNTYKYIMVSNGQIVSDYKFYDEITQCFINYNFSLRIIPQNKQYDRIKNLTGSQCLIRSCQIINSKSGEYNSHLINLKSVLFNETTQITIQIPILCISIQI
ncbi:unnamed protein product [Paramecium primaurelia]|uniref:Uncharacterized protein n=1 Tax=Paramecium primaurelia TaxID=5886 RepID=A0A8S1PD71_PARPR|nr:unnamed protein product [Paramecium primaurelia]